MLNDTLSNTNVYQKKSKKKVQVFSLPWTEHDQFFIGYKLWRYVWDFVKLQMLP